MNIWTALVAFVAALLTVAMFVMADWDLPPVKNTQTGYRGTAMVEIDDIERLQASLEANQLPETPWELDTSGPRASEVYENVQVLGHLSSDQFDRLMVSITEWVSPEQGCAYCHNEENLALDDVYTKVVARRMIEMTWAVNEDWMDHVDQTGVTCYTCHRGHPVPQHVWFKEDPPGPTRGWAGYTAGQNTVSIGLTSLQTDPFTTLLGEEGEIRVESLDALPSDHVASIQDTEKTYSLMMHMSGALGVNCTYCHNTRAVQDWEQSTPARMTAWHGIDMVRALNAEHLDPLKPVFPEARLGPLGDVAKVHCTTCHQGVSKPLNGASMLGDYPSLSGAP